MKTSDSNQREQEKQPPKPIRLPPRNPILPHAPNRFFPNLQADTHIPALSHPIPDRFPHFQTHPDQDSSQSCFNHPAARARLCRRFTPRCRRRCRPPEPYPAPNPRPCCLVELELRLRRCPRRQNPGRRGGLFHMRQDPLDHRLLKYEGDDSQWLSTSGHDKGRHSKILASSRAQQRVTLLRKWSPVADVDSPSSSPIFCCASCNAAPSGARSRRRKRHEAELCPELK